MGVIVVDIVKFQEEVSETHATESKGPPALDEGVISNFFCQAIKNNYRKLMGLEHKSWFFPNVDVVYVVLGGDGDDEERQVFEVTKNKVLRRRSHIEIAIMLRKWYAELSNNPTLAGLAKSYRKLGSRNSVINVAKNIVDDLETTLENEPNFVGTNFDDDFCFVRVDVAEKVEEKNMPYTMAFLGRMDRPDIFAVRMWSLFVSGELPKRMLLLASDTNAGKTTWLEVFCEQLGGHATTNADARELAADNTFSAAIIKNKRIVIFEDAPGSGLQYDRLLNWIGSKYVHGQEKYKKQAKFRMHAMLVMTSNSSPSIMKRDNVRQRINLVRMEQIKNQMKKDDIMNHYRREMPHALAYFKSVWEMHGGVVPDEYGNHDDYGEIEIELIEAYFRKVLVRSVCRDDGRESFVSRVELIEACMRRLPQHCSTEHRAREMILAWEQNCGLQRVRSSIPITRPNGQSSRPWGYKGFRLKDMDLGIHGQTSP